MGIRTEGKSAENSASAGLCVDSLTVCVCFDLWRRLSSQPGPTLTFSHPLLLRNITSGLEIVFNGGCSPNTQLIPTSRSTAHHCFLFRFSSQKKKEENIKVGVHVCVRECFNCWWAGLNLRGTRESREMQPLILRRFSLYLAKEFFSK